MLSIIVKTRRDATQFDKAYFGQSFRADFHLDADADASCMAAGTVLGALGAMYAGDMTLVEVRLHGKLVARWVGIAPRHGSLWSELEEFVNGRMSRGSWSWVAQRLAARQAFLRVAP